MDMRLPRAIEPKHGSAGGGLLDEATFLGFSEEITVLDI